MAVLERSTKKCKPLGVVGVTLALALLGGQAAIPSRAEAATRHAHSALPLLPPSDPKSTTKPCSKTWLKALDCAGKLEDLPRLPITTKALHGLPATEQIFALVDYERVERGEAPIEVTTRSTSTVALQAADETQPATRTSPPTRPTTFTGTMSIGAWAGAPGMTPVHAVYVWLYSDGRASSYQHHDSEWHDRNALLIDGTCHEVTTTTTVVVAPTRAFGSAYHRVGSWVSWTAVVVQSCVSTTAATATTATAVTWSTVQRELTAATTKGDTRARRDRQKRKNS